MTSYEHIARTLVPVLLDLVGCTSHRIIVRPSSNIFLLHFETVSSPLPARTSTSTSTSTVLVLVRVRVLIEILRNRFRGDLLGF